MSKTELHPVYDYSELKALMFSDWIREFMDGGDPFPVCFEFSLTNHCNLGCIWCTEKFWRKKYMTSIDTEIAKRAIGEMAELGTKAITFEGGGEPTLHDGFSDIIKTTVDQGIQAGVITNGTLLNKHRAVLDKLTYVRVSLDAYDRDSFRDIKGEDMFDDVMRNIDIVTKVAPDTTVGISYILKMPLNTDISKIRQLIEKLTDIGVSYIQFKPIMEFDDKITTRKFVIYTNIIEDLQEIKKEYESNDFKIFISRGRPQPKVYPTCYSHRLKGYIAPTGDVYLCCIRKLFEDVYGKESLVFGNLYQQSFREIWKSEKRKQIVDEVEKMGAEYTKRCPACVHMPYNYLLDIFVNGNKFNMNYFI